MPLSIIRNDITKMKVDAIVDSANREPAIGGGVDGAIHAAAGPELLIARKRLGPLETGTAGITKAFLLDAKFVIHVASPVWRRGAEGEAELLRISYRACLKVALEHHCASLAFPLLSAGVYGYPRAEAMGIAVAEIGAFLAVHDMDVALVVYDPESYALSEKVYAEVKSYIDDHYVEEHPAAPHLRRNAGYDPETEHRQSRVAWSERNEFVPEKRSLEDLVKHRDETFSTALLHLIDATGKKDSEIYLKANVDRKHFSKIRSDPDYRPKKTTALAFALALELNLDDTRDLIGRAGFALTRASVFDIIVEHEIRARHYDVLDVNLVLYAFKQPTLG